MCKIDNEIHQKVEIHANNLFQLVTQLKNRHIK